jgi:outer membrane receptor for ferrienterochelin and colicins
LFILTAGNTCGQVHKGTIHVVDKQSREPVAFGSICFTGLKSKTTKYTLTSIDGKANNDVKELSLIAISYVGYTTYQDTIKPGESLEVELHASVTNMEEVVVTAQYTPEKADKSIYRIDVINSKQIEMKAATNMADLLKDQTSMRVSQNGVLGTSLNIQGMTGENIKILVDGIPLVGRMDGNFDLTQINLNNVDHVEVIEGPMSVIYGSNAIAGVINIITRENKTSAVNASANGYYESVGVYNVDASVSMSRKKNFFSLDAARNFFGGYSYDNTSRVQDFKPRRQYILDGSYIFSSSAFRIKVSGDYFDELLLDKGPLQPRYFETALDNEFRTIRSIVKLDANYDFGRKHFIYFLASFSNYDRYKQTYFKDFTILSSTPVNNPDGQDTTGMQSYTARCIFVKNNPEKKFNYQAGIDLDVETGQGKRILNNFQELGDYDAFLSLTWNPVKPLTLQPGARYIYNTKYKAPLVYSLTSKWSITDRLNLRFTYARGFRSPELKELYLSFVDVNHDILGNPDLKAEQSNNFSLNLKYANEKARNAWSAEISAFYNNVDNVIVLAQVSANDALKYMYYNVEKYLTTGLKESVSLNLYPHLRLDAGVAETGVTGTALDGGKPGNFIFGTDVTFSGNYHFIKPELTLSLFYKYSGKNPVFQADQNQVAIGYLYPYQSMDFTATKGFWMNRIRLSAGLKNIFNTKTIPTSGIVSGAHDSGSSGSEDIAWGRTYFLKLSFVLNQNK